MQRERERKRERGWIEGIKYLILEIDVCTSCSQFLDNTSMTTLRSEMKCTLAILHGNKCKKRWICRNAIPKSTDKVDKA